MGRGKPGDSVSSLNGTVACKIASMASLLLIFCAVICPAFVQANDYCDSAKGSRKDVFYNWQYSTLFSNLEESLLSNKTLLDHVRPIFMSTESVRIDFNVELQLHVNGSYLPSCEGERVQYDIIFDFDTFCPLSWLHNVWELCGNPYGNILHMTYRSQTFSKLQWESKGRKVDEIIMYISHLHGSLLAPFLWVGDDSEYGTNNEYGTDDYNDGSVLINLKLERLDCNPPITLTKCVVSELLSWVSKIYKCGKHAQPCIINAYMCSQIFLQIKVYSESGGKLQTHWDQSQKGTVTENYYYYDGDFITMTGEKYCPLLIGQ